MTAIGSEEDLFFDSTIQHYFDNRRFIRRNWLSEAVIGCTANAEQPFVLLTAEPGFGKSVFMAQLAHDRPDWPRYFIRRDQREVLAGVGTRSFLLRIGFQLAARYPQLFERDALQVSVEQRVGDVREKGAVVGAEVEKIVASPFYQGVVRVRQHVDQVSGSVVGIRINELISEPRQIDVDDLQHMALLDPARALQRLYPEQQIVILIDALDEVRYHEEAENLLTWLTNCPELPGNIRFVLTARPPDGGVKLFLEKQARRTQRLILQDNDGDVFRRHIDKDVVTYVDTLLAEPSVGTRLEKQENGVDHFRQEAIAKADGNVGYLDALARGLDQAVAQEDEQTLQALLALKDLPYDMQGLYAFFLHQIEQRVSKTRIETEDPETGEIYDKAVWPAVHRRMLGVLAVAREPVTLTQIQRLGGITADWDYLAAAAESFTPFLDTTANRYRFYHATLPEFLTDIKTKDAHDTKDLYIDAVRWHNRIGDFYWRTYSADWSTCDAYGLNNLAIHLYHGGRRERLYALIDRQYRQARIEQTGSPVAFAQDVEVALSMAIDEPQRDIVQWVRLCAAFARGISAAPPLIIDVLARVGQPLRAQWMAANITFAVDRARAYTMIADHYARIGVTYDARRMLDEAERTLPSINKTHRTMVQFWLARTALALDDIGRAQTLLAKGSQIAFAEGTAAVDPWDLPNVLFWLAKTAKMLDDQALLARIREAVHAREMHPLHNMVLQTMSAADDLEGLSAVAQERLDQPDSSVRLANLALALAHVNLSDLCEQVLAYIDAGAPDHGGSDNPKRHVWARALLGRFDDALVWADTIDDAEQKIVALGRIVEVATQQKAMDVVDRAVVAANLVGDVAKAGSNQNNWRPLARLSALLLNAGHTENALVAAEQVARADVPTTLANTLTFNARGSGVDGIKTLVLPSSENRALFDSSKQGMAGLVVVPLLRGKTGPRPLQTEDRAIPDQIAGAEVLALAESSDWPAAEQRLATMQTPAIRAQTLTSMAMLAPALGAGQALWLRGLDAARAAGWRQFEGTVSAGKALVDDPQVWAAVEAAVLEVSIW